eukprot:gene19072-biopygen14530
MCFTPNRGAAAKIRDTVLASRGSARRGGATNGDASTFPPCWVQLPSLGGLGRVRGGSTAAPHPPGKSVGCLSCSSQSCSSQGPCGRALGAWGSERVGGRPRRRHRRRLASIQRLTERNGSGRIRFFKFYRVGCVRSHSSYQMCTTAASSRAGREGRGGAAPCQQHVLSRTLHLFRQL